MNLFYSGNPCLPAGSLRNSTNNILIVNPVHYSMNTSDNQKINTMKNPIKFILHFLILIPLIFSCEQTDKDDKIIYQAVNQEYAIIRDIQALKQSTDEISLHVDSILNGWINSEFISTGQKNFELDGDETLDIGFEIIDLNKFNPDGLPESFDSLAARVVPMNVEILDNSTYGYPDALDLYVPIFEQGNWSSRTSVLGTFMNAGQFQGAGEKFLGIRFPGEKDHKYGWIRIYCSEHNDTLRIIDYAYNEVEGRRILAGERE